MEIEHEVMDIEDLFLQGKDKKAQAIISIEGKGDFRAFITPVTYGQLKDLEGADEMAIASYVLLNHLFKADEETNYTKKELELLPAGVLKAIVEAIMEISGLNISDEDIRVF